jgi:hypothetical protein
MAAGVTYEPIATHTLSSGATSFLFSSIPGTYTDLICKMSIKNVSTGAIDLYINDDGSRLYSRLVLYSTTTTIGSIQYNAQYSAYITGNANPSTTEFCQYEFSINSYANTTNQKVIQSKSWVRNQGTDMSVNTYESNAAVTSIRIHNSAANNFAAGSMFTLYGITKA